MSGPFHGLKADKAYLCIIPADMIDTEHCERCRMMVAAPQLLEALKEMETWALKMCKVPRPDSPVARARAAIAKAEGK